MVKGRFVKIIPGKLPNYIGSSLYKLTYVISKVLPNGSYVVSADILDLYVTGDQIEYI
jgi:hypothetical protein